MAAQASLATAPNLTPATASALSSLTRQKPALTRRQSRAFQSVQPCENAPLGRRVGCVSLAVVIFVCAVQRFKPSRLDAQTPGGSTVYIMPGQ